MLTSINIQNFRCFRQLDLKALKRVNLIAGQNNTGKTCLLEALTTLLDFNRTYSSQLPTLFRALSPEFWPWLFYKKDIAQSCEFVLGFDDFKCQAAIRHKAKSDGGHWSRFKPNGTFEIGDVSISVESPTGRLPSVAVFTTNPTDPVQDAIDFNRAVVKRRKQQIEGLMRLIEPRLLTLESLQIIQNSPVIYADLGLPEMIPVTQLGQGFCRLLDIFSGVIAEEAQVVLIDEIENGIHHSVLPTVWKGLALAAEQAGIQVFATTHSWECIVAAHKTFAETSGYDFALHRLERIKDDIKAITYDREALEAAIKGELEVR